MTLEFKKIIPLNSNPFGSNQTGVRYRLNRENATELETGLTDLVNNVITIPLVSAPVAENQWLEMLLDNYLTTVDSSTTWSSISRGQVTENGIDPPVALPQWTIAYDGVNTYGALDSIWTPTGTSFSVKVAGYKKTAPAFGMLLSGDATAEYLATKANGSIEVAQGTINATVAGISPIDKHFELEFVVSGATYDLFVDGVKWLDAITYDHFTVKEIGRLTSNLYGGQIYTIELTDNDTPSNSIKTNATIESETQPTDMTIYDTLTGDSIGTYMFGSFELVEPPTPIVTSLGDSTISDHLGAAEVITLLGSVNELNGLSVPGDTINGQLAIWEAQDPLPEPYAYVVIQVGLNDLDPAEAIAVTRAKYQNLVDVVKADIGSAKLFIAQMTPAKDTITDLWNAGAQTKWLELNESIAGLGANPITGVDYVITSHVAVLDDGTSNLKPEYDTGDGIHGNGAAHQVIADAWVDVIVNDAGLIA